MAAQRKREAAISGVSSGNAEPQSFEEAFLKLEETVRSLESGPLSLDEATRLFEQGIGLARRCNELLSAAELKVSRLQTAFAEQMRFVPDADEYGDEDDQDRDD